MMRQTYLKLGRFFVKVQEPTISTIERISRELAGVANNWQIEKVPANTNCLKRAVSQAVAHGGLFRWIKTWWVRKRIVDSATLDELCQAVQDVLDLIDTESYVYICEVTARFNGLIAKENEQGSISDSAVNTKD